jgi:hypothetical protein
MSRLSFKEKYFDEEGDDDEADDDQSDYDSGSGSDEDAAKRVRTKYAGSTGSQSTAVVGAANKNRDKDEDDSSEMEDGEADEDEDESVDADTETASTVPSATSVGEAGTGHNKSSADVSSWLTKFLRTKRVSGLVMPPPDFESFNDDYLKQFNDNFSGERDVHVEEESEEETPVTTVETSTSSQMTGSVKSTSTTRNDGTTSAAGGQQQAELLGNIVSSEEAAPTTATIRLFNLVYDVTEQEVIEFCADNGVLALSVQLGEGKALGQASITAKLMPANKNTSISKGKANTREASEEQPALEVVAATVCDLLREKECMGRKIRVKDNTFDDKRRRSSGSSRYFLEGMTTKCNNCGIVGHMAKECDLPIIPPPCHLCAGQDHESGNIYVCMIAFINP